jgi:cell wall-associated NlpC family hydrolase
VPLLQPPPLLTAPVVTTPVVPLAASAPAAARTTAVQMALSKIGSPYRWGGTGPSSFDCSGLVKWAFAQAGVDVPRTSRALSRAGTPVSRADLQPGDLVFFYSPVRHVGIYIGDGQMVHSSRAGKPVAIAPLAGRPFHSARRI